MFLFVSFFPYSLLYFLHSFVFLPNPLYFVGNSTSSQSFSFDRCFGSQSSVRTVGNWSCSLLEACDTHGAEEKYTQSTGGET